MEKLVLPLGTFMLNQFFWVSFPELAENSCAQFIWKIDEDGVDFFVPLSFLELYQIILCLAEFLSHNNNSTRGSGSQVKLFSLQLDPQIAIKINRAAHHWANRRDQALLQQLFYSNFYK